MKEFIDKTSEQSGTPLNRATMMAIQGFEAKTVVFNEDGSITETNADGHIKTTIFNVDGSIKEIFTGQKTISKITSFGEDGKITEVVLS